MEFYILTEPVEGVGFSARSNLPWDITTTAPTRREAEKELRRLIDDRFKAGAEIVTINIPTGDHPLAGMIGMLKDDPLLNSWNEAMAEWRRRSDDEPS